jgi:kynurenine formamidase
LTIEPSASEPEPVEIEYISHEQGAEILGADKNLKKEDFPDGMALSHERIKITSHSGTHLDAPSHYGPVCEGTTAKTIEEVPLEWCYGDGLIIDAKSNDDGPVTKQEIINYLNTVGYKIKPGDIVLINTGADQLWGTNEYFTDFRGVTKEATDWIVKQGVKIIGIDSFGFDPPFHKMLDEFEQTNSTEVLWPAHVYGRQKEYCQIERLCNLDNIPTPFGFKLSCFPIKVKDCGAGWTRVVAILE